MENYKAAIYQHYVQYHNAHILGEVSLSKFKGSFPVNAFYWNRFLPASKTASILEIGCGDGGLVYWLQQLGYGNVAGVDLSEEQIELGQKLGVQNLYLQDLNGFLKATDQKYDLIIARDVFEHFTRQDFFDTLLLIRQRLVPSGKLVIQSPNGQGYHFAHYYYSDITHEMPFTESSLRQMGLAAGFQGVNAYPIPPFAGSITGRIRSMIWSLKTLQLRFWKMIETGSPKGIFTANLQAEFIA